MHEINVEYMDRNLETMLSETETNVKVVDDFVFLGGSQGQSLTLKLDSIFRIKFKFPMPQVLPDFKYSININYDRDTDDVELLFSSKQIYVGFVGETIAIKEGDDIVRLINPKYLKSVKVTTYTEGNK